MADDLLSLFRQTGALLDGHFVLRSGLHSRQFFQCALLLQHTAIAAEVCGKLADKLEAFPCDAVISPVLLARLLRRIKPTTPTLGSNLTEREHEVLAGLSKGLTTKAIAAELFLSVNTIRNYVQSVLNKLEAHSKLQAVAIAVRIGILDYPLDD